MHIKNYEMEIANSKRQTDDYGKKLHWQESNDFQVIYTWCIECSMQAVKGKANLEVQRDQEIATNDHQWKSNLSIAHSCFQIFFLEFFPNTQESTFITGIKQNA